MATNRARQFVHSGIERVRHGFIAVLIVGKVVLRPAADEQQRLDFLAGQGDTNAGHASDYTQSSNRAVRVCKLVRTLGVAA